MKTRRLWVVACLGFSLVVIMLLPAPSETAEKQRLRVEKAHGIKLPASARNYQHISVGGYFDRGELSVFELDEKDVSALVSTLSIKTRSAPVQPGVGDPRRNGWNVWPTGSPTFVPGNKSFNRLKRTWEGPATPVEMLSCDSPVGDWLHVEIWSVGDHALLKIYTDWN